MFAGGAVDDKAADFGALQTLFAVNVGGVVAAVRAAVPSMREGGRIITIGSVAGEVSPWPRVADYSATKAAVAAYTRGWARDLGRKGITVNTVQPGPIDTDMAPKDGPLEQLLENRNRAWPVRQAGRGGGSRRFPRQSRRRLYHRHDAEC